MNKSYDVIIIGGGIVGLSFALTLAQATSEMKIAIIDQKPLIAPKLTKHYDSRVFAINLASKQLFEHMHCFEAMAEQRISPYRSMYVWDGVAKGAIRFDAQDVAQAELGFIIENQVILHSLYQQLAIQENIELIDQTNIETIHTLENDGSELIIEKDKSYTTQLLIGADGAQSWLRNQIKIPMTSWPYRHHALVTTVNTEKSHQQTAWQCFTKEGPLAFLPLDDVTTCSIVWSVSEEKAKQLQSISDQQFCSQLAQAFEYRLGSITHCQPRVIFPLSMRHAQAYVKPGIALLGDAVRTIHPLAGQGLNLGLNDVACLSKIIIRRFLQRKAIGSLKGLREYERSRKSHNIAMISLMETFKQTFDTHSSLIAQLRSGGLNLSNQFPFAKRLMMQFAMGDVNEKHDI